MYGRLSFTGKCLRIVRTGLKINLSSQKSFRLISVSTHLNQIKSNELKIPMPWGYLSGQIFGDLVGKNNKPNKPIVALHGYLDNSNSFLPLAPELCESGFYIISLDFPGHGFSSHLPKGMQYTPKVFLTSVRRAIIHLNLSSFIFLTHSYGTNISYLYDTVFKGEVEAIMVIDHVINIYRRKQEEYHTYWKKAIDGVIDYEKKVKEKKKKHLTHELALTLLMDANKHLDKESAMILLKRGIMVNKNGELNFSRDIKIKIDFSFPDLFLEVVTLFPNIVANLSAPILNLVSWPPSYGEEAYESTRRMVDKINSDNKQTKIEIIQVIGSHHIHMINPKLTAKILIHFLKTKKLIPIE